MSKAVSEISLAPSVVARALGATAFLLIIASIGGLIARFAFGHDYVKGLVPLFDVNDEANIPTYFSLLLMLFCALLLAVTAAVERCQGALHGSKWAILSCGFLLMGYDEVFKVHERLTSPMTRILGDGTPGVPYFAWVIPGLALVFVLMLFFLRFLWHLPQPTRRRFLVAATLYLGGAIGVELVGGQYAKLHGTNNWEFNTFATAEESLEMAGIISFIWALLRHCADKNMGIRVRFHDVLKSQRSTA
jgi:hypothetical protein